MRTDAALFLRSPVACSLLTAAAVPMSRLSTFKISIESRSLVNHRNLSTIFRTVVHSLHVARHQRNNALEREGRSKLATVWRDGHRQEGFVSEKRAVVLSVTKESWLFSSLEIRFHSTARTLMSEIQRRRQSPSTCPHMSKIGHHTQNDPVVYPFRASQPVFQAVVRR